MTNMIDAASSMSESSVASLDWSDPERVQSFFDSLDPHELVNHLLDMKNQLVQERTVRAELEAQLRYREEEDCNNVQELQLQLLSAQQALLSLQQKLQAAESTRAVLQVENTALQLSLQQASDDRFRLDRELRQLRKISNEGSAHGADKEAEATQGRVSSFEVTAVASDSLDMASDAHGSSDEGGLGTPDMHPGARADLTPDASAHLDSAWWAGTLRAQRADDVEAMQRETQALTQELVERKIELAELKSQHMVVCHELATVRLVNEKLTRKVAEADAQPRVTPDLVAPSGSQSNTGTPSASSSPTKLEVGEMSPTAGADNLALRDSLAGRDRNRTSPAPSPAHSPQAPSPVAVA